MKRSGIKPKPRKMVALTCAVCSESFERRSDSVTRASDGVIRCKECSDQKRFSDQIGRSIPSMRKGSMAECAECGAEFYKRLSNPNRKLCSDACQRIVAKRRPPVEMIAAAANNRGKNNGRYNDGKRVGQNRKYNPKTKVRKQVIERDGGDWCLHCGRPGPSLHLHRVIYGSQGGQYEASNCVQLCAADHAKVHSSKRVWMPPLLEHLASGGGMWTGDI